MSLSTAMFYTNGIPEVQEDDVPEASSDAGEICPGTVQVKENKFSWYRKVMLFARYACHWLK